MGYYTYYGDGYANAYRDTRDNIRIIREQTGRPSIPIHVIAGDAAKSSGTRPRPTSAPCASTVRWAAACTTGRPPTPSWAQLRTVRINPRQTPALPLALLFAAPLGYCGADRTHPKEVFYETAGQKGEEGPAVPPLRRAGRRGPPCGELEGRGAARRRAGQEVERVRAVTIPASMLNPRARNVIGFVARGEFPAWQRWGVRDVTISAP